MEDINMEFDKPLFVFKDDVITIIDDKPIKLVFEGKPCNSSFTNTDINLSYRLFKLSDNITLDTNGVYTIHDRRQKTQVTLSKDSMFNINGVSMNLTVLLMHLIYATDNKTDDLDMLHKELAGQILEIESKLFLREYEIEDKLDDRDKIHIEKFIKEL